MKKWLLLAGTLVFLWLIQAPLLASWISHKTSLPLFIGQAHIGRQTTEMTRLTISNPWRFKRRTAFAAKKAEVDYQISQLRSDPVVFEQISMDQVHLVVEFLNPQVDTNNWTVIGRRILKKINRRSKGVQIRKFVLTNVKVEIIGKPNISGVRTIDRIELDNINSEKGFPSQSLIEQIFQESGIGEFLGAVFYPEEQIIELPFRLFFGPK